MQVCKFVSSVKNGVKLENAHIRPLLIIELYTTLVIRDRREHSQKIKEFTQNQSTDGHSK